MTVNGIDMVTVLDADPSSPHDGAVLATVTVDTSGRMPHHTEPSCRRTVSISANDFEANKSYILDLSVPNAPRRVGQLGNVPHGRKLHSFERLPNGHVITTVQFGDPKVAGAPGGLAEFDADGQLVRAGSSRDAAFPGARIRTYALAVVRSSDRVVTTSSPMDTETTANVIQVWRLSDLKLLKTLIVPASAGDSANFNPFEVRALADGSVLVNSYYCGFFHVTDLAGDLEDRARDGDVGVQAAELWLLGSGHHRPLHGHADHLRPSLRDARHLRTPRTRPRSSFPPIRPSFRTGPHSIRGATGLW